MTATAAHDLLVMELLERKHSRPGMSVAVTALVVMKGQQWPLEQLAQVLDVAIEYLDAALGDAAPVLVQHMRTEAAFRELTDGLHTPMINTLTATDPRATTQGVTP